MPPRRVKRARARAARLAEHRVAFAAEFIRSRVPPEGGDATEFVNLLRRTADSDLPLWGLAEYAAAESGRPLTFVERTMVAVAVSPRLAGVARRGQQARG